VPKNGKINRKKNNYLLLDLFDGVIALVVCIKISEIHRKLSLGIPCTLYFHVLWQLLLSMIGAANYVHTIIVPEQLVVVLGVEGFVGGDIRLHRALVGKVFETFNAVGNVGAQSRTVGVFVDIHIFEQLVEGQVQRRHVLAHHVVAHIVKQILNIAYHRLQEFETLCVLNRRRAGWTERQ